MIIENYQDLIGNTPLYRLKKIEAAYGLQSELLVKLEYFNPGGSVKDRPAAEMLKQGFATGKINENTTIIEPTSGNTGIGLAAQCAALGLKIILTMPETMSVERRMLLAAYGAEIVLTDGKKGMKGAIEKAEALAASIENSFIPAQFDNKNNVRAHYLTTGPEIYQATEGQLDYFVAGVGTGGTISGVAEYFKEKELDVKIVAVEPEDSSVLSTGVAGAHKIQGIGAGFVPSIYESDLVDEIVTISNEEAFAMARMLAEKEGLLLGISSAAAIKASINLALKEKLEDQRIVVIAPDTGERYLSTPVFKKD